MSVKTATLTKVVIRPLGAKNIDEVYDIQRSLVGLERALIDIELIASNFTGIKALSYVAVSGKKVVGFILARQTYIGEPVAMAVVIQGLGVHIDYQRQGIASSLINTVIEACRSRGIKTLRVMLSEHDAQTEGFFRRLNFHPARLVIYDKAL